MTKELNNILTKEIAKIIYNYSSNEHIKAIYLLEFQTDEENINIKIVLISDIKLNIYDIFKMTEYDYENKRNRKIRIVTVAKDINDYDNNIGDEESIIELYNGILVFDRDREITKIKKRLVLLPVYSNIMYDLNNTIIYDGIKKYRKEKSHKNTKLKVLD